MAALSVAPGPAVPVPGVGVAGRRVVGAPAVGVAGAVVSGVAASAVGVTAREQCGQGGRQGEAVVGKVVPNALADGVLDTRLKELGAANIIVAGFMTHLCVSTTARAALDLGYGCTVLAPACATRDLPDGQGGVVPAEELHRVELAMIATDVSQLTG